ncbi:hypothetical protein W822_16820 [Advenella kashmirensis W13003]|uniref:Uncharacterized protein n=1 Tax=Advenella kashmirensis W13003 TaxID=1424334 RepID=V8QP81_9BURK|nr:rod shape-determining protein MreD [Advenella kashmirensis]ETF01452.1 hypothetical protein W822_16820 [Advenella kashmirensis W13003]
MIKRNLTALEPLQRTDYFYGSSPVYAWITIVFTWLASLLPWRDWEGSPDILILVLAFWCVQQVRGVGLITAVVFGLLMDVHDANVLGAHGLAYVLVIYGAKVFRRRMMQFGGFSQMLQMLPVFFLAPFPGHLLNAWLQGAWGGWTWVLSGLITGVMWVVADLILKLPLRPVDDNETLN